MNKIVSKNEYQSSAYALRKLAPALKACQQIDLQTTGYDSDVFAKVESFTAFLEDILNQCQAVIDQGDAQYENRPVEMINRAASRFFQIPHLIEAERKRLEFEVSARQFKFDELSKQSFTPFEINNIVPPISQIEIDASRAVVASLQSEAKSLELFLVDAPSFDTELLKNTALYPIEDIAA